MAGQPAILFVDDEENIRLTLSMMLESEGFKVTTAATVTDALRLMSEQKFDILISDMNIGRAGDGFTVVSAMRSTQPEAVRFILTGFPDVESALRALREEVDDYLIKPTEIEEIVQKIRSKLETREHRKEITQLPLSAVIKREREYITEKRCFLLAEIMLTFRRKRTAPSVSEFCSIASRSQLRPVVRLVAAVKQCLPV